MGCPFAISAALAVKFSGPGTYREDRVAAVHYLRFRLTPEAVQAFKSGGREIALLIDHPNYRERTVLSDEVRRALAEDLG